ncbi:MAG: SHOCT domain-containing protein [Deltaproteobacteria bacterium]|nr:SHOCT domain-containing protein [Deltaproteobacteria bacterium]
MLPVFDEPVIPRLAPLVRDAFARATSRQKVAIEVRGSQGSTVADLFLFDGSLLARVETVASVPHLKPADPLSPGPLSPHWILVPRDGQWLHTWPGLLGLTERPRNWLMTNVTTTLTAKPTPPPTPAGVPAAATAGQPPAGPALTAEQYRQREGLARERLQFLKELKDSGLISEQEYTRKQKEILDQL